MTQFIKVISLGSGPSAGGVEEEIGVVWKGTGKEQGVRPRLINMWPLPDGLLVLLFDWEGAQISRELKDTILDRAMSDEGPKPWTVVPRG